MSRFGLENPARRRHIPFDQITAGMLRKVALSPSHRAPSAAELHHPSTFRRATSNFTHWGARDLIVRDGCVEGMSLSGRAFLSCGADILKVTPLREVKLVAVRPFIAEISGSSHLEIIRKLDLSGNCIGDAGIIELAKSHHLRQLRELAIGGNEITDAGVCALAEAPWFPQLESLDLTGNSFGADGIQQLLKMVSKNLRKLAVSRNSIGCAFATLAKSRFAEQLEELRAAWCLIGPESANGCFSLQRLSLLRKLDLRGNLLGDCGISTFINNMYFENLRELDLGFNDLGDEGARMLADTKNARGLETLHLPANRIGAVGLHSLARSSFACGIEELNLNANPIGNEGAVALLKSGNMPNLKQLDLGNCNLGTTGVEAIAQSGMLKKLEKLSLAWSGIAPNAVRALVSNPHLQSLQVLDLSGSRIGFAGARTLAEASSLPRLHLLYLRDAELPPEAVELLRSRFGTIIV